MAENEAIQQEEISIADLDSKDFKEARKNGLETVPKPEVKVEEKEEKSKAKGGFQARIDRLIKRTAELEKQLEEQLEAARKTPKSEEKEIVAEPKGRPQKADFVDKEDEYIEALVDWKAEQKILQAKEAEARAAEAAQQKQVFDAYNRGVAEAKSVHEDFTEVVGQDIDIPVGVQLAIVEMEEKGPEVAYFLGNNPEICEELMKMSRMRAIAEVWKICDKLNASESDEEEETEEEKPAAKAKVEEKPARRAPEPIRPVGNGKTRSSVPLNEMSMADYKKARAAGRIS
jgi:hypothetical protein